MKPPKSPMSPHSGASEEDGPKTVGRDNEHTSAERTQAGATARYVWYVQTADEHGPNSFPGDYLCVEANGTLSVVTAGGFVSGAFAHGEWQAAFTAFEIVGHGERRSDGTRAVRVAPGSCLGISPVEGLLSGECPSELDTGSCPERRH